MDVITTHLNADFDCLGSMIAAKRLYPEAMMVFPGGQERSLREFFLKSAQYAYGFCRTKDINFDEITRLILVDVRQESRIGPFEEVARRKGVELHIYDHHVDVSAGLSGSYEKIEPVGSTVTVLTHIFMEQEIVPTADEATMMMLGLYEDTGNLTFHTTTVRDYQAAAYLLSHGANLNVVSDFLVQELTPDQIHLLNDLIANHTVLNIHGINISVAHASVDHFVGDIATLAHKLKDMENLDVLIIVVRMESRIFMVARSRRTEVHVGEILDEFHGGGHASAASATVRDQTLIQVLERLPEILQRHVKPQWQVRHLMSTPVKVVQSTDTIAEAHQLMTRYNINALPVVSAGAPTGILTRQLVDKAIYHGLKDQPVSEYMHGEFHVVAPEASVDVLKSLIANSNQRFVPVIDEGRLVGAVTRTDLLRHLATSTGTAPLAGDVRLSGAGGRYLKAPQVKRLMRNRLKPRIQEMLHLLGLTGDRIGVPVYVVGGFVRDLLLGHENLDLDVVVEGDGIVFAEAFAAEHACRVRAHRKFGTAVVIFPDGFKLDVASARMEYYLRPGALPDVEHASVRLDLFRRDFTINTMAISLNTEKFGEIQDFYGGQKDLDEKAVRVLHNLSFVEDPTRVFRAVRFEQRLGFTIGKQTEHLLKSAVRLKFLDRVSGLRIFNELYLILTERDPLPALQRMVELDLLKTIDAGLEKKMFSKRLFIETRRTMDWFDLLYTGEPCRRWVCFFLGMSASLVPAQMNRLCQRLSITDRIRKLLTEQRTAGMNVLRKLERRPPTSRPPMPSDLHRWLIPLETEILLFLMALTEQERVRQWISFFMTSLRHEKPLFSGNDLEKMGIAPGPVYKQILDDLLRARLNGRVASFREEMELVQRKYCSQ
jgi:tRNA nucleotidyltransferase (CCA-adding enzyme)